nr:hypothetical protein [Tanacetum cinerariifolium]
MHDSDESADYESMPEDDLRSVSGFEDADSDEIQGNDVSHSKHTFPDHNASAELLSLPDHLDHICEEVSYLNSKLDTMESSINHQVSDGIKSTLPALVTTALQEQLHGLLSNTLRDCLSSIIQESLQTYIQAYLKRLETKLSKTLKSDMGKSMTNLVNSGMKKVRADLKSQANDIQAPATTQGEPQSDEPLVECQGEQPADLNIKNKESAPSAFDAKQNEGKELVVHKSEEKKPEEIISVEDDSHEDDKQPLSKRFKIMTPILDIPNPTPLNTFVPKHLLKPKEQQKELTPLRDSSKGKAVATIEEPVNELVKYQEEGGSNLKMPKLKSFITPKGPLSQEEYNNQIKEIKRLKDLKVEQEKSKQELRKLLNPGTLNAQAEKWIEHEAKKAKMMEEYKRHISFRADILPIIKISYVVNSTKGETMKITRGDNPLNLVVHPNFKLKTLGFSEWLEVHALAFKKSGTSNNLLLQSLRAKFQWVINQAKRLGIPPPHELATFGLTAKEKKRRGVVINEHESRIFFMNGNTDISFQRESEFYLTPTVELIRLQNQIKVDSEIAREMVSRMNYVIEARSDCSKAREIVEKNLDNLG